MDTQLNLKVAPPDGGAAVVVLVDKICTGTALKERVQYIAKAAPQDQILYFENGQGSSVSSRIEIEDNTTLEVQGVESGALITIEQLKAAPESASKDSIEKHGRLSYYHRADPRFASEHSVQVGGDPVSLGSASRIDNIVGIERYTWADDGKSVKVFIDVAEEPRVLAAAGDGKRGNVDVSFQEAGFCLTVAEEGGRKFILNVPKLSMEIIPGQSKFRVSAGKRITLTLKKVNEFHHWFTLLKTGQSTIINNMAAKPSS